MPLVAAKCTECGANIEVDDTKEAGICKYCGTAFITEKAINNYTVNITNHIVNNNNNNFAGANVTIQSDAEDLEQLIKRATTFESLNEFMQARNVFYEITSKYPMDYRGWLGMIISETKDMTDIYTSDDSRAEMLEYFDKAIKVANSTEQEYIFKQKARYEDAYKKEVDRRENGEYIAAECNLYDYRDVVRALGCESLIRGDHKFEKFTFVLGNYVECRATYLHVRFKNGNDGETVAERNITFDKSTCEKYVDRNNIDEILSGCRRKSENQGGCYIATCVYGSYDCPQVWTLRRFRDYKLDATWYGRLFIKCYYATSPILIKWFGKTKWFRRFWKAKLDKMIVNLNSKGIDDTYYTDKY